MTTMYLTEPGAELHKTSDRFVVEKDGVQLIEVQAHTIGQIVLLGPVQVTTQALYECMQHGIELAFCSMDGELICQLTPPLPLNLELRLLQYDTFRNPQYKLESARNIVRTKQLQCLRLLRHRLRSSPALALEQARAAIQNSTAAIDAVSGIAGLLGVEGSLARSWYQAFSQLFDPQQPFTGRSRRPPLDPVNALLSLGYSLAATKLNGLIDAVGLDPHLGLLHVPEYGRPSLALDLVEEFRTDLVDRFVLSLFNRRQFNSGDFEERDGGIYLRRQQLKRFLGFWEEHQRTEYNLPWGVATYGEAFRAAIQQCRSCLERGVPYRPMPLKEELHA